MNMQVKNQALGQTAILLCALCWSTSGLFIKLLDWHPMVIAGARSFIAALFMLMIRRTRRRGRWGETNIPAMLAAGFCYAGAMITFVIANKLTASANAILLQYSAPVWACLLAWLLIREKPRVEHWAALVLVISGMVVFFKDSLASGAWGGDALAVLSGILFGANSVFMRMQKDGDPSDSMLWAHIITAGAAIPFFALFPPTMALPSIRAIAFMGVVQLGCASVLFSYGIKRISSIQAMLTASIEPVLNPLWVLAATGEQPSPSALIGGAIILFAVIFSSIIRPVLAFFKR